MSFRCEFVFVPETGRRLAAEQLTERDFDQALPDGLQLAPGDLLQDYRLSHHVFTVVGRFFMWASDGSLALQIMLEINDGAERAGTAFDRAQRQSVIRLVPSQ